MSHLILSLIYKVLFIDANESIESNVDGSTFTVKIPVRKGVGRMKYTLDIEDIVEYFSEYPDGGDSFIVSNGEYLYGEKKMGARMPPKSCFCCGGLSVINESYMEFETYFFTITKKIELCDDCDEYVRNTIYREFVEEKPEALVTAKI
jgi:hypothetical protein